MRLLSTNNLIVVSAQTSMMEVRKPTSHKDQPKAPSTDLLTLPPELLLIIASHLSLPDKYCLLLCNHYLLSAIGKRISSRNASYLTRDRFVEAMDWWEDQSWILQAGKRLPFVESAKRWLCRVLESPFFWFTVLLFWRFCKLYLKLKRIIA